MYANNEIILTADDHIDTTFVNDIITRRNKMEVTLDHVSLHTIEGHFCSLLKSNVILLTSPFISTRYGSQCNS